MRFGLRPWNMKPPTNVLAVLLALGLAGCAATGMDYLVMPPLGAGWKLAREQEERDVRRLREFVREGETLDKWTELISWQSYRKDRTFPPETLLNMQKENIQAMCPGVLWNMIERKERAILYEWRISSCKPSRAELQKFLEQAEAKRMKFTGDEITLTTDQHVIALVIEGDWTIWHITYNAKVGELTKDKRTEWIKRFSDVKIEIRQ